MSKLPPPQLLLGATLVSLSICAFSLRANNQHMLQLRQAVYTADEKGSGVEPALVSLQSYVTAHMNTRLDSGSNAVYPPIQLKYTYDRLVQARSDKLATTNSQTYSAAQGYCEQQNSTDFSGRNRVPCIEQYVQSHGVQLPTIPDALYKFSFASPVWSPDVAGWSLVTTILLAIVTLLATAHRFLRKRR
ncbi:MAG: hypothetical protein QFB87_00985 [Patescibacteria group bacterium]|nr:hypothetical protein [Patescibacteria group bacterium]